MAYKGAVPGRVETVQVCEMSRQGFQSVVAVDHKSSSCETQRDASASTQIREGDVQNK